MARPTVNAAFDDVFDLNEGFSLWGQRSGADGGVMPVCFLHACRAGDDDALYHVLAVGETRGVFRRHLAGGWTQRDLNAEAWRSWP